MSVKTPDQLVDEYVMSVLLLVNQVEQPLM